MVSVSEKVRSHLVTRWGQPTREASFRRGEWHVRVLKWSADANDQGVDMYVTVGGAQLAQGEHRQEFLAGLVPAQDDIASPLAALALYGEREGVQVDHGHTVPAGCSLWPGTDMETFLVLRPKQMVVEPLTLEGGPHVEFLQAVPIYESERGFVREHGAEELLRRWEEAQVPFWSSTRPAAHPQGKDSG